MELINKLEKLVLGWAKNVPHLPVVAQKWLGTNVWWIARIGAIVSGIAFLFAIGAVFTAVSLLASPSSLYYIAGTYSGMIVVNAIIGLVFLAITGLLMAVAVTPLKAKQKKGWVLLFFVLLVEAVSIVVNAVLSFSVFGFISTVLFGAIALAIGAYFLTEIHGQFGHAPKATIKKA